MSSVKWCYIRNSRNLFVLLFSYTSASNSNLPSHPPFLFIFCIRVIKEVRNNINDFISHSSLQNVTRTGTKILFFMEVADYMQRRNKKDIFCLSAQKCFAFLLVWLRTSIEPYMAISRLLLDVSTNPRFVS